MSTFDRAKAELAAAATKYGLGFVAECNRCGTMLIAEVQSDAPKAKGEGVAVRALCPVPHCLGTAIFTVPASQVGRLAAVRAPNAVRGHAPPWRL